MVGQKITASREVTKKLSVGPRKYKFYLDRIFRWETSKILQLDLYRIVKKCRSEIFGLN